MSLSPGARLGPYEILSPIGAGGMGEVFRARDTRLDRTVAIKILPALLGSDPEFRERFDREARAISSLSHPHICTLHDVGEHEGTAFLVMEHLDGETLAARLARGPLPLDEALTVAIQIADALDAAHRRGIVHRDIKPANMMLVRRAGQPSVKLLDFGLARTAAPVASPGGESVTVAVTRGLTAPATILGTLQYMAPEQIEALEVDPRTDIFAFGVVLYEMLTGQKAFAGSTPASLIGAILKDEPPPVSTLQALAPAALERVVRRCIAKDREDRWQTARDLRAALQWIAESGTEPAPGQRVSPRWRWLERLVWTALVTILLAALAVRYRREPPLATTTRATLDLPPAVELVGGGGDRLLAISPDGRHVAFTGTSGGLTQIYLRSIDRFDAVPIAGTEGGSGPFFSPDGRWIGFFSNDKLHKVALAGGPVVPLCEAVNRGAAWAPDDVILFASSITGGLSRVSASGGTPEVLTELGPDERSHRWPSLLPDGKTVLFTIQPTGAQFNEALIAVRSLVTGEQHVVVRGGTNPSYLSTGHIVFGRAGTMLAVPYDPRRPEQADSPVPVIEGVSMVVGSGAVQYAIASTGALVYASGNVLGNERELVWVDEDAKVEPFGEPRAYLEVALSPDGQRLATSIVERGGNPDVWVCEVKRCIFSRLTFSPAAEVALGWTPDGRYVSYRTSSTTTAQIVRKPFDGSGPEETVFSGVVNVGGPRAVVWHPSGRWIAYESQGDVYLVSLNGERRPLTFLGGSQTVEVAPAFSPPDGRWIAYQSSGSSSNTRFEIYVRPFQGPGGPWQVSFDFGIRPIWARTGRRLFYRSNDRMMAVDITPGASLAVGPPRELFRGQHAESYDVAPDGRFLMIRSRGGVKPPNLRLVLNWLDDGRSRVTGR